MPLDVLGKRVAAHRASCGLSIRQLAGRAMVSKTSIVSLEHGRSCLPATLVKVCAAMNLHLERLVDPEDTAQAGPARTHRKGDERWYGLDDFAGGELAQTPLSEAQRSAIRANGPDALMTMFRNLPSNSGVLAGVVELTKPTPIRSHPGAEFVYVLSGRATVTVDGSEVALEPGESVYIESMSPHGYASQPDSNDPVSLLIFRLGGT